MDKPRVTPKDVFVWAGAMLSLYVSVFAFINLLFSYLNFAFPNTLDAYYGSPYGGAVSYDMAALIVLVPLFFVLMRLIRRDINRDPSRAEVWVRRWALYLTIFIAGVTIAVDLITLLTTFLSGGDLSLRFVLKVAVVLLVAAAGVMHFLADIWGYWGKNPRYACAVAWAVGALVVLAIATGFIIFGTPQSQRLYRFDEERVSNLQNIQSQILFYYQSKQTLPPNLDALNNSVSGYIPPVDPQTGAAYGYQPGGSDSFELCAAFSTAGSGASQNGYVAPPMPAGTQDNWQHGAGRTCFERTIDPDFYPPIRNQQ